jgi:hypothetical protein
VDGLRWLTATLLISGVQSTYEPSVFRATLGTDVRIAPVVESEMRIYGVNGIVRDNTLAGTASAVTYDDARLDRPRILAQVPIETQFAADSAHRVTVTIAVPVRDADVQRLHSLMVSLGGSQIALRYHAATMVRLSRQTFGSNNNCAQPLQSVRTGSP